MTSSEAPSPRYRLKFLPDALDEWNALDGSVKEVLKKLLKKRLEQPRVPGAELHGDLRDCYKIKLLGRFGAADCWKPWSVPYFPTVCLGN